MRKKCKMIILCEKKTTTAKALYRAKKSCGKFSVKIGPLAIFQQNFISDIVSCFLLKINSGNLSLKINECQKKHYYV